MMGRKTRSFKESVKLLEADIQHANTLSLGLRKGREGACLQMRLNYGPAFLMCLFSWADHSLLGALGLLHILIFKVLKDGTTTMSVHERRANLRQFYGYILPSLEVLDGGGITERESLEQNAIYLEKSRRQSGSESDYKSIADLEREQECGICLDTVAKIVLPSCSHSMCIKCYRDWRLRSTSCPFCRTSLKRVNSKDLWIYMNVNDSMDSETLAEDNLQRLFGYVEKLPLVVSNSQQNSKPKSPS